MKVRELMDALDHPMATGDLDAEISRIAYDSRQAAPGVMFTALRGSVFKPCASTRATPAQISADGAGNCASPNFVASGTIR